MSWGSTPKELDDSNFWREVGKTLWRHKGSYLLFTPLAIGLVLMATVVPDPYWYHQLMGNYPLVPGGGGSSAGTHCAEPVSDEIQALIKISFCCYSVLGLPLNSSVVSKC